MNGSTRIILRRLALAALDCNSKEEGVVYRRRTHAALVQRERELKIKRTRLLDAYLAESVDETIFKSKTDELKIDLESVREELGKEAKIHAEFADMATAIFDLTQRAEETWLGSNTSVRRDLLDVFCSNRHLDGRSLYMDWRKPFDSLAKQPDFKEGVVNETPFEPSAFTTPEQQRYCVSEGVMYKQTTAE